jgi:hypothetical protein
MPQVSIVIANWNGKHYLKHCLSSVFNQSYRDFEVVVVDNNSTDGSVEFIETNYPQCKLVKADTNLGFACANNLGIQLAKGEYIATLNNDTIVDRLWLEKLIAPMIAEPTMGMCASKILFYHTPTIINSTGIVITKAGTATERDIFTDATEISSYRNYSNTSPFGPCGCAALYRKKMLDELDGFDADFFAYLEDVDLAWRARWAGWNCAYVPDAIVYHVGTGTGSMHPKLKSYLLARNKVWLILKNYPLRELLLHLPLILFYEGLAIVYSVLFRHDYSIIRGKFDALLDLHKILVKRAELAKRRSAPSAHVFGLFQAPENPYRIYLRQCRYRTAIIGKAQ